MSVDEVFLVHAICCLLMTGIIWFVQVVHYPLFYWADQRGFPAYAGAHQQRTGRVVAPLMLIELGTGLWLVRDATQVAIRWLPWLLLTLLLLIWVSTFAWQNRLHRRLSGQFNSNVLRRLIRSNWVRTLLWTARSLLIVWALSVK